MRRKSLLLGFVAAWILSWVVLIADRGRTLPLAPKPVHYLVAEAVTLVLVFVLLRLARDRKPINHESGLPIRRPATECAGILLYLLILVAAGRALDVRAHVASAGMSGGAAAAWHAQTTGSVLRWALFHFASGVVVPLAFFLGVRGYSPDTLLLRFPRGAKWVAFCATAAFSGLLAGDPRVTFGQPFGGYAAALVLFGVGTFLPVMILFESLLAPRLAIVARSAVSGAVLSGVVYALWHPFEFYLRWGTPSEAAVSVAWLAQIGFYGVVKGISTLWSGSAWTHIFTTHTVHMTEVGEVVRVFRIR
ncbi:MAG TPA: hypothetical protein VFW15_03670 [Thermoanaerobaculia bacterium]|nr:hypothetical protein [Thermoanaerobaculia bacterium]